MKLKALDQMHVSSVKPDSLRPGEEFEVSTAAGKELVKAHPDKFSVVEADDEGEAGEKVGTKSEPTPRNKAEDAPANKAETRRKAKG